MTLKNIVAMSLLKPLQWSILVCALVGINSSLHAHTLEETSAQVILRDGQIEIRITTDLEHLIAALQNNQAWLMGDIDTVMPENLSAIQQEEFIKKALEQKTSLTVNEKVISFKRITLASDDHTTSSEIVFEAKHVFTEVTELSISFHKALGAVHVSFVKPQYKLLRAGEKAKVVF